MTHTHTQQIKTAYRNYCRSGNYNLYDCYEQPSWAKREAMDYCTRLMEENNGKALKIIGYNTMTFSVGFLCVIEGKEAFVYITKSYDRYIFINEMEV